MYGCMYIHIRKCIFMYEMYTFVCMYTYACMCTNSALSHSLSLTRPLPHTPSLAHILSLKPRDFAGAPTQTAQAKSTINRFVGAVTRANS